MPAWKYPRDWVLDRLAEGLPRREGLCQMESEAADRATRISAMKFHLRFCEVVVFLPLVKRNGRVKSVSVALEDVRAPVDACLENALLLAGNAQQEVVVLGVASDARSERNKVGAEAHPPQPVLCGRSRSGKAPCP